MRAGNESAAAAELKNTCRISRAEFDKPHQAYNTLVHQFIKCESYCRFQPGNAKRRAIVLESLFVGMVRCMVGGDRVDRAVLETLKDRFEVLFAAKRWSHFGICVVAFDSLIRKREVMGSHLAGYVYALVLGTANRLDSTFCRDVSDMDMGSGVAGQDHVADRVNVLGKCWHPF